MKSEHRHDLKTNELRRFVERVKPFFEKFGNQMLLGLAAVILVAGGAVYWVRSSNASAAAGWTEIANCRTAENFADVADKFENTVVGAWARLNEAESHLHTGLQLSFRDREAAVSDLKKAKRRFEELLKAKPLPDEVRERGLYGFARCLETMSDGNTDDVVAAYEKLIEAFPQSVYVEEAKQRIADLEKGSSQQFYAWFHAQNPKPEDRKPPQDGPAKKDPFNVGGELGAETLPEIPPLLQLPEKEPAAEEKAAPKPEEGKETDGAKDSPKPK